MSSVPYANESIEAYYARMEGVKLPAPITDSGPMIMLNWELLDSIKKNRDMKRS